jgi:two-component system alkaline phosphatase synthesis response regulator PhoP
MFDFLGLKKKSRRPKILIVDDERDIVQTFQDRLEMEGYTTISAANGKEGLEKAIREKPDVILLDVIMPDMDGFEMLEALRKYPEGEECTVIMLTVRSHREDVARAEAYGAEGYLVKPFDLDELLEKIESVLKQREAAVE